ncbi:hypothetical protein BpHYR1_052399 [Brachionus plicatilis]|uniref:Uncharacterized protein n=1 Tax=Brachionus plicatilis TaxID=10195 RepID=A0A3M7PP74_BRAPC|nr:hypothetical protein BpHYR1_052399 [Brachionus plicatilis]
MTRPGLLNGHNKLNSHTGEQKDINHLLFYYNIHSGSSFEELKSSTGFRFLKKSRQTLIERKIS